MPVSTYEQLYPELEKVLRGQPDVLWPGRPQWFAKSSGTTNARSKYIPVTAEALHHGHYRAGRDMLALGTHFYPQERLLAGKTLSLGGAHAAQPVPAGRAGLAGRRCIGRNYAAAAAVGREMRTPPLQLALLDEWEDKIERIARHVLRQDVRVLAGVPTWMVVLLRRVVALAGADRHHPGMAAPAAVSARRGGVWALPRAVPPAYSGCAHALPRNLQCLGRLLCPAGPAR